MSSYKFCELVGLHIRSVGLTFGVVHPSTIIIDLCLKVLCFKGVQEKMHLPGRLSRKLVLTLPLLSGKTFYSEA